MSLAFEINQRYFIKFPGGHPKNHPKIVIIIIFLYLAQTDIWIAHLHIVYIMGIVE